MKISKNTLLVHLPQHVVYFSGLVLVAMGHISFIWILMSYIWWIVIGYFGFSVFYHRYFAHRSFEMNRFWEIVWGYLGLLVGRGSPINMASLHCAEHHRYSDTELDPHSPKRGKLWSYFLWAESHEFKVSVQATKHLIRDKFIRFLDRNYLFIFWVSFVLIALIDWRLAVYGMFGGGVIHYHVEAAVSTFCHTPGYGTQDYKTKDDSRNIRGLFNLFFLGTGLHNSHHAHPKSYHYATMVGDFDLAKYVVPFFISRK